jgi:hypothetical protein
MENVKRRMASGSELFLTTDFSVERALTTS